MLVLDVPVLDMYMSAKTRCAGYMCTYTLYKYAHPYA